MSGKRFGRLVVIAKTGRQALCQCDCGRQKTVHDANLYGRRTKSCGCILQAPMIGKQFGRLVALENMGIVNGRKHFAYRCKCDCGTKKIINGGDLRKGTTRSCGCLKHDGKSDKTVGRKFGRLTVLAKARKKGRVGSLQYQCKCECGRDTIIDGHQLRAGHTLSCGCLLAEGNNLRHGMARQDKKAPEYGAWSKMKGRCYNKTDHSYDDYGGRGITVCDRWRKSFKNFFADMGYRPAHCNSIDRIDNDGNYEPGNCRWATQEIQSRNRRPASQWKQKQGSKNDGDTNRC